MGLLQFVKDVVGPKDVIPNFNPFASIMGGGGSANKPSNNLQSGAYPGTIYYNPDTGGAEEYDGAIWRPVGQNGGATNPPIATSGGGSYTSGGSSRASGGSYAAPQPTYDPQVQAYYDQQIGRTNTQLGQLDPQFNVGRENILNQFQDQNNQLNLNESRSTRDYNMSKTNAISENEAAKQRIDGQVRTNNSSLLRMLGRAGSGNSSASETLAPFAAARAGSVSRSQVQNAYGRNIQGLDTNYNDFTQDLGIARTDLERQRDTGINGLQSQINNTRQGLLSTLANLTQQRAQGMGKNFAQASAEAQPFIGQIDALGAQQADLSRQAANPTLAARQVAYNAPTLASYDYTSQGGPQASNPLADQVSPYYNLLFGNNKRKNLG